ncbi:MAG: TatD family hydrolase [Bacteroidia bacterium]|nr:TatD family hydrolase [Bacteroidia bacterium]
MITDTHIHLYDTGFDDMRHQLITEALNAGVQYFVLPNVDSKTIEPLESLCQKYPNNCFAMMGLHPCHVQKDYIEELKIVYNRFHNQTTKIYAVGEIGLDLYWDNTYFTEQQEAFKLQCQWANDLRLPVSIHARNATQEAIDLINELQLPNLTGVFHCFSGNAIQAQQIIDKGFYLGIGGVLTFKKSGLDEIVSGIDIKHLLLETDAPYLAPVPHRGKRNDPAFILFVAKKLAELKNVTLQNVASVTTQNAINLFNLPCKKY